MATRALVLIDCRKKCVARYVGFVQTHANEFTAVPPAEMIEAYRQSPEKLLSEIPMVDRECA